VVVAIVENEFVSNTLQLRAGRIKLKAGNPTYPDIVPKDSQNVEIWGVVVAAIKQFKCRFRLDGESYAYTCLKERLGASCHSRHFHLKIRIPTEMYLRVFPAMQVLGGNIACKRNVLNPFKERWEPLAYKFSAQSMFPWDLTRLLVLSDIK
jgi:hypothetical protein